MTTVWFDLAEVSVGQHWYWQLGSYSVHGQVLITSWIVLGAIILISFLENLLLKKIFITKKLITLDLWSK